MKKDVHCNGGTSTVSDSQVSFVFAGQPCSTSSSSSLSPPRSPGRSVLVSWVSHTGQSQSHRSVSVAPVGQCHGSVSVSQVSHTGQSQSHGFLTWVLLQPVLKPVRLPSGFDFPLSAGAAPGLMSSDSLGSEFGPHLPKFYICLSSPCSNQVLSLRFWPRVSPPVCRF